jgi:hypothetical protein
MIVPPRRNDRETKELEAQNQRPLPDRWNDQGTEIIIGSSFPSVGTFVQRETRRCWTRDRSQFVGTTRNGGSLGSSFQAVGTFVQREHWDLWRKRPFPDRWNDQGTKVVVGGRSQIVGTTRNQIVCFSPL